MKLTKIFSAITFTIILLCIASSASAIPGVGLLEMFDPLGGDPTPLIDMLR